MVNAGARSLSPRKHDSRTEAITDAKRGHAVEVKQGSQLDEILWTDLREFDLSVRLENCMQNANIKYVGELVQKTEEALLKLKNFGPKSLREVKKLLAGMELPGTQLQLGMQLEGWPGTPPLKGWPAASLPPVIVNMNAGASVAQVDDARHISTLGALVRELTADGKAVPPGIFNVFDEAGNEVGDAETKQLKHDQDRQERDPLDHDKTIIKALAAADRALDDVHEAHVRELAELARAAILPYFSEKRLTYRVSTSVDTWYIENERGRCIMDDALPAHVRAVLDFPVSRRPPYYICLGFCVEEIKSTDWIEQQPSKKSSMRSK